MHTAPYASDPTASRGREFPEERAGSRGPRSEFQRDRDRIVHSIAFRRLRSKTQVFIAPDGDHYRTRLTHSLEVAQVGRVIARELGLNEDLTEALCLGHDIGHPPFGHAGEKALEQAMVHAGGYDHNAQGLRTLARLEGPYCDHDGLNLTWETLEGLAKHNGPVAAPSWALAEIDQAFSLELSTWPSLEAQVAAVADDIAYGIHDFEDGIVLRLLTQEHWQEVAQHLDHSWAGKNGLLQIETQLFKRTENSGYNRKQAVGALVHALITSAELKLNKEFEEPLLGWNALLPEEPQRFLKSLKATVSRHVIQLNTVQAATYRGRKVVLSLFEALSAEPEMLLPSSFQLLWKAAKSEHEQKRIICDFIAGMTDQYANRFYERLFLPGHGSVFDRL